MLVCRKCSKKLDGGFGKDGEERLAKLIEGRVAGEPRSCIYTGRLIAQQKRILDFIALARCLDATGRPYRLSLVGQDFGGAEAVLRRELAGQIAQGSVRLPGRLVQRLWWGHARVARQLLAQRHVAASLARQRLL